MNIGQSTDPSSLPVNDSPPVDPQSPANESAAESQPVESSAEPTSGQATSEQATSQQATGEQAGAATGPPAATGIGKGPLAARGTSAKPQSPAAKPASPRAQPGSPATKPGSPATKPGSPNLAAGSPKKAGSPQGPGKGAKANPQLGDQATKPQDDQAERPTPPPKLSLPNLRQPLPGDIQAQLDQELAAAAELDAFLGGSAGMAVRKEPLEEGQRVSGTVLKFDDDSVFVSLGGPDEGVVPLEQFSAAEPTPGSAIEVIVRGVNADGLYQLTLPGETVSVTDWSDIETGSVVEATVTGSNSGGLECTVAGISGFIPISQISEHRVEDTTEFVGQKMVCVVTEANPRRGNLVVSRRAILEREREQKRQEQLETIEVGDLLEGTVGTVKDFGAFVDLGGLEGLIHISKLSWDRIKHPSEVIEPGQRVKVKVEKIDKQTGKIGLSYRDLLENPWDAACESLAPGSVVSGSITRVTAFGAFVRLSAGVEGLVHISEVAGHRVTNVGAFLQEGQTVDVKVLSVDRDTQKIALSIKQAQHKAPEEVATDESEEAIEVREPAVKATHSGPLKGGNDRPSGGAQFGLRW